MENSHHERVVGQDTALEIFLVVFRRWRAGLHALTLFFFSDTATTEIYTLSLHDALPILAAVPPDGAAAQLVRDTCAGVVAPRSEEHTSELQSRRDLVCRLLLEKKKT